MTIYIYIPYTIFLYSLETPGKLVARAYDAGFKVSGSEVRMASGNSCKNPGFCSKVERVYLVRMHVCTFGFAGRGSPSFSYASTFKEESWVQLVPPPLYYPTTPH